MGAVGTEQTFQSLSQEVAERFLQTVVVLDDGATMEPLSSVGKVVEPDPKAPIYEEGPEGLDDGPDLSAGKRNPLDASTLISGFADHGLVCAVLTPSGNTNGSDPTLRTSRRADIVILDWQLGDEGEKTQQIITKLIEQDQVVGGRLRMIVVYTAETDLEGIRTEVSQSLIAASFTPLEQSGTALALTAQHTRIVFIRKGKTDDSAGQVNEADLPRRVVEEFVEFGKGILANVALAGIAAIREETHQVLARFHSGLDAPFLSHRILLERPRDAEGYSVDLLSSEIVTLLRHKGIGAKYTGSQAIRLSLSELECNGSQFQLMKKKDSDEDLKILKIDELMKLVDFGPSGLTEIVNVGVGKGKLHERLYLLFTPNLEEGKKSHYEFARTSARAREPETVGSNYRATLDLGSVVLSKDRYFVCIQPSCDALRLSEETQFIFASLCEDIKRESFDLVVKDVQGNDVCLKLNQKASGICAFTFDPGTDTSIVSTSSADGIRKFTDVGRKEFIWICDLRVRFAQRFVHRIASNLSRIGLDEFEWQRSRSSSG